MAVNKEQPPELAPPLYCLTCRRTFRNDMAICPEDSTLLVHCQSDPYIGTTLAGLYEIQSVLGHGASSVVYKARHLLMDRVVAIKMLLWSGTIRDERKIRRFQQEARTTSRLHHPRIAMLYDFGISPQSQPYLVMEYLDGSSLAELIAKSGPLPHVQAVKIFVQVCEGLEHAHCKGIVHRDIKPSNIIVSYDQRGDEHIKLLDFGIAKLLPTDLVDSGQLGISQQVYGSPLYMSPEQCSNKGVDSRCDIYGLGVSFLRL